MEENMDKLLKEIHRRNHHGGTAYIQQLYPRLLTAFPAELPKFDVHDADGRGAEAISKQKGVRISLEIGSDDFKSVPKHPPKLKTHVRHPECVI